MGNQDLMPNGKGLGKVLESSFVDYLGLSDCETLKIDRLEHILLVHALYNPIISEKCPKCGGIWKPYTKGKFLDPFSDIPRGSNPVVVVLTVLQHICSDCNKSLDTTIPWLHPTRQMTLRLLDYILDRVATLSSFAQIALDTCLDENTVRSIFIDTFRRIDEQRSKDLPRVLGIDEVFFHRKYYTILVDVETGNAVDLLPGLRHEIIKPRFDQASNRKSVEYILQDFSMTYRSATTQSPKFSQKKSKNISSDAYNNEHSKDINSTSLLLFPDLFEPDSDDQAKVERVVRLSRKALAKMLPNAKVVGDHFHFKKAIEDSLDKIRVGLQKTLPDFYFKRIIKDYTKEEKILKSMKIVNEEVKNKAKRAAKKKEEELNNKKKILFKHPSKLNFDEWSWLKDIFVDHPILERGWEAKNRGLNIFPEKPPLGRSKRAREAARVKRLNLLITEAEAAQRLEDWVKFINKDPELKPFFRSPLSMIKNWHQEIIRIGTTVYSNAGAESKNHYLRILAAISRGLNFEVLRARLLWADERRRTNRWPSFCYEKNENKIDTKRFVTIAKIFLERNDVAAHSAFPNKSISPLFTPQNQRSALPHHNAACRTSTQKR